MVGSLKRPAASSSSQGWVGRYRSRRILGALTSIFLAPWALLRFHRTTRHAFLGERLARGRWPHRLDSVASGPSPFAWLVVLEMGTKAGPRALASIFLRPLHFSRWRSPGALPAAASRALPKRGPPQLSPSPEPCETLYQATSRP
ncbi:hypothetical protein CC78DRAFT_362039 [Lojkania enalia]|uniref:Uncharacterized protein n=1 Tax=Lojkania enalia TaxID=147567 RepID=A0A9P4K3C2_9PLEO|nr:hypothetical protein CC78DRAFT_362039 [Didymosphaeria enalia]